MSAIIDAPDPATNGGVARYKTSIKVEVASHNAADRIILTPDVFACSVGKNLKGEGRANVSLVAARNYLNMLFANDYINIYFDIGDGQGWTRVFFGLIDRVEEDYRVSEDGQASTSYHIIATDFQKVFTKVQVYYNPALANREDWRQEDFAQSNIGGITVLSRGVNVSGSPAEVVQNYILVMLGFGTQMVLPDSYRPHTSDQFRASQSDFILRQFESPNLSRTIDTETLDSLRQRLNQDSPADTQEPPQDLEELSQLASGDNDEVIGEFNQDEIQARILSRLALRRLSPGTTGPSFLLDVLDLYTFVENLAIDGRSDVLTVLDSQGDIMSILRSLSNEVVNELFFDLRPVKTDGLLSNGSDFSRDPDDWGGNVDDPGHPDGIQYVPAVVMREYPFSTIDRVDASNVQMTIGGPGSEELYGVMPFGAIFSNEPNTPGRHVIRIPSVAISDHVNGVSQHFANKHLDVAVLHENEITATRLGRSDEDHFNVFELLCNAVLGSSDERYLFSDLLPLVSPIHVMRHGLRLRQTESRYVFFGNNAVVRTQAQPVEQEEEEQPAEEEVVTQTRSTEIEPPVRESDTDIGLYYHNRGNIKYGYRLDLSWRRATPPVAGPRYWHFHNGIDIPASTHVPIDDNNVTERLIPVRAIADGQVVVSAPNGVYDKYGACVVILHPQIEVNGRPIMSGYHHLAGRAANTGNESNFTDLPDCSGLVRNTRFRPRSVQKGDIIGWMGNTFGRSERQATTPADRNAVFDNPNVPHLHFEIDYVFPPKGTPGNGGPLDYATETQYITDRNPGPPHPASGPPPTVTTPLSIDPYQFFLDRGIDLEAFYAGSGAEDVEEDVESDDEATPVREETEEEQSETQTTDGGAEVDTIAIRNVIARWTLLQDHWYQHNLEYISGTINCRPAPEIRVGYRLDVPERNMSFYVEGVQHQWQMSGKMTTTIQVTRGQPNNPYPVYVLPPIRGLGDPRTQRRTADSRLAQYTMISDPVAVRRALVLRAQAVSAEAARARTQALIDSNTVDEDAASGTTETVLPAQTTDNYEFTAQTLDEVDAALATDEGGPVVSDQPDSFGGVQELEQSTGLTSSELDSIYDELGGNR